METFLNRYRNITVLLMVIFAQLVLLAVQVKNDQDVRIIRVWAVTTVTPVARIVEWFRGGSIGFVRNYILMHDAAEENRKLHDEVGRLRLENNFLRNELSTADRAKALQVFQSHTQSKMLAASIIGTGAGSNSKVVFVNRGSGEGVMRGMAVVTPDGIVGKVINAYPTAAEVLLVTDPEFAAGVVAQKNQARGTLKGQGTPLCRVDYVPFDEKVEVGEWFYTSGDDRIFPRGFAVGIVKSVRPAQPFKEILVEPSGLQHGLEDVLIILEAVHQSIPETPLVNQPVYMAPPPPQSAPPATADGAATTGSSTSPAGTEADKLRAIYQSVGEAQNHNYGSNPPGTRPVDLTRLPSAPGQPLPPAATGGAPAAQPGGRAPANPAPNAPKPSTAPSTTPAGGEAAPSRMARQAADTPAAEPTKPPAKSAAPPRAGTPPAGATGAGKPTAPNVRPPAAPPKQ